MNTLADRQDKIAGLTSRYVDGDISEIVYTVSLSMMLPPDEIRYLVQMHQAEHRNSMPYKRGMIS